MIENMTNNKSSRSQGRWKTLLILLCSVSIVLGIVYMKRSSSEQKAVQETAVPQGKDRQVAIPDTTADPSALPTSTDTVEHYELPDTLLGRDKRSPYEAGYEDGYEAGCDDGALGQDHETYDETSNFRTESERQTYTEGYREGYEVGFEDGKAGKQFNI